jgi:hypothetical protein
MSKRYNIGFNEKQCGECVGFIVTANNTDHAEQRAREAAKSIGMSLMPGSLRQRRDDRPEANNDYFDQSYRLVATVE